MLCSWSYSIHLFFYQYHNAFVSKDRQYSLKLGVVIPPIQAFFFCCWLFDWVGWLVGVVVGICLAQGVSHISEVVYRQVVIDISAQMESQDQTADLCCACWKAACYPAAGTGLRGIYLFLDGSVLQSCFSWVASGPSSHLRESQWASELSAPSTD